MADNDPEDASEFLNQLLDADTLNQDPEHCDIYAQEFKDIYLEKILIPKMMELSPEFKLLYYRVYGTGSYYDGLRNVTDPNNTELDINVVLKLPDEFFPHDCKEDVQIITHRLANGYRQNVPNGFVKILCKEKCVNALQRKKGEKFNTKCNFKKVDIDDNYGTKSNLVEYILHPNKTLHWFSKLVHKASNKITTNDLACIGSFSKVPWVKPSITGPSQPIKVEINESSTMKRIMFVDLVVAFEFNVDLYNPADSSSEYHRYLKYKTVDKASFFVIPKILQSHRQLEIEKGSGTKFSSDSLNWRVDFHDQERIILQGDNTPFCPRTSNGMFPIAKQAIRIIKLYKRMQGLKLSSYLIKSVVLRLVSKEKQKKMFLPGQKLNDVVLFVMKEICSILNKENAPYFFDGNCNIFWKTSSSDLLSMKTKIFGDMERIRSDGVSYWRKLLIKKLQRVDKQTYLAQGEHLDTSDAWSSRKKKISKCKRYNRQYNQRSKNQSVPPGSSSEDQNEMQDVLINNLNIQTLQI